FPCSDISGSGTGLAPIPAFSRLPRNALRRSGRRSFLPAWALATCELSFSISRSPARGARHRAAVQTQTGPSLLRAQLKQVKIRRLPRPRNPALGRDRQYTNAAQCLASGARRNDARCARESVTLFGSMSRRCVAATE